MLRFATEGLGRNLEGLERFVGPQRSRVLTLLVRLPGIPRDHRRPGELLRVDDLLLECSSHRVEVVEGRAHEALEGGAVSAQAQVHVVERVDQLDHFLQGWIGHRAPVSAARLRCARIAPRIEESVKQEEAEAASSPAQSVARTVDLRRLCHRHSTRPWGHDRNDPYGPLPAIRTCGSMCTARDGGQRRGRGRDRPSGAQFDASTRDT